MKQSIKKNILNKGYQFLWKQMSLMVKRMADTGEGTDDCLEIGCLPMNVNYYSPIPDIKDLENRKIWEKKSELPGIDFHPEKQLSMLERLGREFRSECDWPLTPTPISTQLYLNNNSFSYGCASALHTMICHFKPQHVIEIGSGNSSKIISKALELNKGGDPSYLSEYIVVDPYPDEIVSTQIPFISKVMKEKWNV